jgi:hypothetical protein
MTIKSKFNHVNWRLSNRIIVPDVSKNSYKMMIVCVKNFQVILAWVTISGTLAFIEPKMWLLEMAFFHCCITPDAFIESEKLVI